MKIKIEFSVDNAAFDDFADEVAAVLRRVRDALSGDICSHEKREFKLRDSNGNTIGSVKITP